MGVVGVAIPPGLVQGASFMVHTPLGQSVQVNVPAGMTAGQMMYVEVPVIPAQQVMERDDAICGSQTPQGPRKYDPVGWAEAPNPEHLRSCLACCCFIDSCYYSWPKCIGIYTKGVCLCCNIEALLCKSGIDEGSICICWKVRASWCSRVCAPPAGALCPLRR